MSINTLGKLCMLFFTFALCNTMSAQTVVKGNIKDKETKEDLIGVNILVKNTIKGTITDLDGNFDLSVNEKLPLTLIISIVGYETIEVAVTSEGQAINVMLGAASILAGEVVVSASRMEEKILQSPVTIEKLDLVSIKNTTSADYYDQILKLKGVTNNQASLTFNTINTRGFGGGGNTRFVQLQDGMDNAAPLLNFPTGNVVGISELDIRSVELIPGAASALYGPNAFNGILIMQSKDPFQYQGLSVQLKTGFTQGPNMDDDALNYSAPLIGGAIRYAKAFNDKFAFKLNFSGLKAQDWRAQDYVQDRNLAGRAPFEPGVNPLGNSQAAGFDGMNLYGDETLIPVAGGIRRQGFREQDLLESNNAESFKYDAAVHYRITDKIETNVSYKYGLGSTVYQGAERYALRNFSQQFLKWELNASNWNIRAYGSFTNDGDSYNLTALGGLANEGIWRTSSPQPYNLPGTPINITIPGGWAVAANLAAGFPNATPASAKAFADAGGFSTQSPAQRAGIAQLIASGPTFAALPQPFRLGAATRLIEQASGSARPAVGSDALNSIIRRVRDTAVFQRGGAGFIDNSRMYHAEGNYNLSSLVNNVVSWQIGGNVRQFGLFSDGTIFNEDPDNNGTNERITINEFGFYTQVSKTFLDDRFKLTGSLRYDKNQNFNGNVTPRFSAVYSAGADKQHNFRASYQTGFRNPSTQGQFIYFPAGTSILLGSTEANASPFGLQNGGAWTKESYDAYLRTLQTGGTPAAAQAQLKTITFDFVQPEKLRSFEFGYRGIIGKKLALDGSAYFNTYSNFIDQVLVVNKNVIPAKAQASGAPDPIGGAIRTTFFPYMNAPADINSRGLAVGGDYAIKGSWNLNANYSYNVADKTAASSVVGFENYDPGFNMPENMYNIGISNRKLIGNLGGTVSYRWQQDFYFKNAFASGNVPAFGTVDGQVSYFIKSANTAVKLGATNMLNKGYVTNVGNPMIGRMVHLTMTYDQFAK